MQTIEHIPLADIEAARRRLSGLALRTPLVRLNVDDAPAEIWLKLENLQPIGSFKLRGAGNAMTLASRAELARGVWTPSAGNMAQGVAWNARRLGVACRAVVPEHAAETKLAAIRRLGAEIVKVPFESWWEAIASGEPPRAANNAIDGLLVHPVSNPAVIAGNGSIGLEILEDLPDVDAVIVPFGGGGLVSGIASAIRASRPKTQVYACEVETAAPLAASLRAGEACTVEYTPSFVDGIGGRSVLPSMWPIVSRSVDGSIVVKLDLVAAAIRLLVERNRNWLPKLESFFARRGRTFVVVGAAHLVGPDGLLAMLKSKGYSVEQQ